MEKVWLKSYPQGVNPTIAVRQDTLVDLLNSVCNKYPNKACITWQNISLNYQQTKYYIDKFAKSLTNLGIKKGDRVAVIMPNLLQYPIAVFAILSIGAIVVNINPLYTESEMEYILTNSGAKTAIILNIMAKTLNNLVNNGTLTNVIVTKVADLDSNPLRRGIIELGLKYLKKVNLTYTYKALDFRDMLLTHNGETNPKVNLIADDLAFIQYTGATTGRPKGAMLSHRNIVANLDQIHSWLVPQVGNLDQEVVINALPLYHIFSLTANLFTFFFAGSENVMITNPRDISSVIKVLRKSNFTILNALDTLYNHLLNSKEFMNPKYKYPYFKYSVAGGMPCRESVAQAWFNKTGVTPANCYGLTEASPAVTMSIFKDSFDGSVGRPIPSTELEIRDIQTGAVLDINQTGLIYIRGPQLMRGYWNAPEQTAKAIDAQGWFHTSDLGYIDSQGKLFISGRESDLIIVSGFNVYPAEIESALDQISQIKESAVVGMPDEATGEVVCAFITFKDSTEILTIEQITAKCRANLASYKVPKHIYIVSEIPKTLIGKIDKKALVVQYCKKG